jgi:hypothetical protein
VALFFQWGLCPRSTFIKIINLLIPPVTFCPATKSHQKAPDFMRPRPPLRRQRQFAYAKAEIANFLLGG